ncbi:MAG: class C sortase [Oribacterium sp.]|nr:class C sortase [Oribacterium sp.]
MKKRIIATILIILLFLAGLGIVLYPYVSEYVNAKHASRVVVNYDDAVKEITPEDFSQYFEVAEEYNERLRQNPNPFSEDSRTEGYETALNVDGSGMMGYLEIPKISVKLPFYHGTSGAVLNEAVGHLEGSSLPVGGEDTHVVLSAHRGLPSAKLFTDLPELGEGDIFILTVLDRKMTYQVDQILTVLPTELESLEVEDGQDYVTLMTCTPYGINTHRLLVRGHRIENLPEEEVKSIPVVHVERELTTQEKIQKYIPFAVMGVAVLFLIALLIPSKKDEHRSKESGEADDENKTN